MRWKSPFLDISRRFSTCALDAVNLRVNGVPLCRACMRRDGTQPGNVRVQPALVLHLSCWGGGEGSPGAASTFSGWTQLAPSHRHPLVKRQVLCPNLIGYCIFSEVYLPCVSSRLTASTIVGRSLPQQLPKDDSPVPPCRGCRSLHVLIVLSRRAPETLRQLACPIDSGPHILPQLWPFLNSASKPGVEQVTTRTYRTTPLSRPRSIPLTVSALHVSGASGSTLYLPNPTPIPSFPRLSPLPCHSNPTDKELSCRPRSQPAHTNAALAMPPRPPWYVLNPRVLRTLMLSSVLFTRLPLCIPRRGRPSCLLPFMPNFPEDDPGFDAVAEAIRRPDTVRSRQSSGPPPLGQRHSACMR